MYVKPEILLTLDFHVYLINLKGRESGGLSEKAAAYSEELGMKGS